MTTTLSPREALTSGWSKMKEHLGLFVPLCLLSWMIAAFEGALARAAADGALFGLRWLLSGLLQAGGALLAMAWIRAALLVEEGQAVRWSQLVPDLGEFFGYVLASAMFVLMVAFGCVLLIVPGVLWAATYGLYGFVLIHEKVDPFTALRRSAAMTAGHRGALLTLGLALIGVNLLGALAFGVGLFATLPTSVLAVAHVYRRLAADAASAPEHHALGPGEAGAHAGA